MFSYGVLLHDICIFAMIQNCPMKKLLIISLLILGGIGLSNAQNILLVEGTTGNLHLTHKVSAKETWFAIGRLYNIPPKDIISFNGASQNEALTIGQSIRIPLTTNFSQDGAKEADEVFVPLYHVIQEKEWMYRISVNHNKVPIENLKSGTIYLLTKQRQV